MEESRGKHAPLRETHLGHQLAQRLRPQPRRAHRLPHQREAGVGLWEDEAGAPQGDHLGGSGAKRLRLGLGGWGHKGLMFRVRDTNLVPSLTFKESQGMEGVGGRKPLVVPLGTTLTRWWWVGWCGVVRSVRCGMAWRDAV